MSLNTTSKQKLRAGSLDFSELSFRVAKVKWQNILLCIGMSICLYVTIMWNYTTKTTTSVTRVGLGLSEVPSDILQMSNLRYMLFESLRASAVG
ncbi:hypothetical protein M23134_03247 [Microscilla marina ATCC 23134]|uniref:Uncharacterized protein n=1 Tax=Microscilla marina ATCC 23134 TaxID=313606 RepID=A1ZGJ2_MICM2|nr:hypothetical protein M23134_03247 [Microscilla marina ATCC 23134]